MNTYVMGEIAVLLAITAIAGILIGWCIKSLFSGRSERQIRASVAHDVDQAAADVDLMRNNLHQKDADLQRVTLELQQLRGRDVSLSAGNTTQVEEINNLKVELSQARKTLDRNRSEFAAYRDDKQQELQSLSNKLASFKTGGAVHDTQINQAHDSIAALRAAARENDKIIDSLRARIKEADTTVENLRSQLKQSESTKHEATMSRQQQERATSTLNAKLKELSVSLEKQKRDYNTMLETKNRDISTQMSRLEELGNVQTLFKQKEHDYEKLSIEMRDTSKNAGIEINELKQKLQASEQALADTRDGIKRLQDQVDELTRTNSTQAEQHRTEITQLQDKHRTEITELRRVIDNSNRDLQAVNSLKTQIENKNAEVVALNDMLRDVSGKRDQSVEKAGQLEQQLKDANAQQQKLQKNEQQMAALASALKQREADYAKLRGETDAIEAKRATLATQVTELQNLTPKLEQANREAETLRPQIAKLNADANEQNRQITSLMSSLDQKNAEIEKLRGTGANLSALQTKTADLEAGLNKRDTDLADAQLRVKNLTASLKERDGEIRMLRKTGNENDRAQQDINRLTESLKQRDAKLNELTTQLASVEQARKQTEVEMQRVKAEQETEQTRLRSSDEQRAVAYKKLQDEFNKISATRDDYEKRVQNLQLQLDDQQRQYDEKLKQSEQRVQELQPQIGTLQTQVSTLASERQQLTANLSDAENHKLQLTERDAEIRRLQIELKEASSDAGLQASLQDQTRKVDGLTAAMLERDNEISRLNKIITDNRLGSKQQSSEVNLLKEEIDAQGKLIRSLEDQAENTLQLHKKIAQQSTEIESLRADLHLARTRTQESTSTPDQGKEIATLKQRLDAYETDARAGNERNAQLQAEITRLQSTLSQRTTAPQQARSTPANSNAARVVSTRVTTQPAKPVASDKPRVFVRHGENPENLPSAAGTASAPANTSSATGKTSASGNTPVASNVATSGKASTASRTSASAAASKTASSATATTAEGLAGTQMPGGQSVTDSTPVQRALYTRDGYRLKRTDGTDDLALLPGFTDDLADKLRNNSVNEFEQVALWTQREISHFADRLGINAATAGALPNAAKEILAGKFRVDSHREVEKN